MRSRIVATCALVALLAVACGNAGSGKAEDTTPTLAPGGTTTTADLTKNVPVDAPGVSDTEIKVAAITTNSNNPTGSYAPLADGIKAYFAMINDGGGIYGRKLVLSTDTAPVQSVVDAARGADVLIHEATFAAEERDRARETLHSTAAEAAEVARSAEVGLLALTHLSNRYFGGEIEREAQEVFPDTVVPRDLDIIEIPFRERGTPELIKGGAKPP